MPAVPYIHKKNSRSRSLKISVSGTGEVIVSTPPFTPRFLIDRFVQTHASWIEIEQRKVLQKKQFLVTPTTVSLFGTTYTKKTLFSPTLPLGISLQGKTLLFNPTDSPYLSDPEKIETQYQKNLTRFLKSTAASYILPRTQQLATNMSTSFGKITLREQKTRWGSCSSKGNLNFNWRLVHFLPAIIDYVIIHELAHRTHMNHSSQFWHLVAQFDPAYRTHQGWLQRNGLTLG